MADWVGTKRRVGPARRWIVHLLLVNPVTYLVIVAACFGLSQTCRTFLYQHTPFVRGQAIEVDFFRALQAGTGWWWIAGAGAGVVAFSYLRWRNLSYSIDDHYVYRRTGLLSVFEDPMALAFVADCNAHWNLAQRLFGTADLILTVLSDDRQRTKTVRFRYVHDPDEVHRFILSRCGGKSAHQIV